MTTENTTSETSALATAEAQHITGYQWGDGGRYIGPYDFPNNTDKEHIHLPPRTTLKEPPADVPAGHMIVWDAGHDDWALVAAPAAAIPSIPGAFLAPVAAPAADDAAQDAEVTK